MSGLPPYHSSPEAKELWEITGALAEEDYYRKVYTGEILDCDFCPEREDSDWPWSCPKECSNKENNMFMVMLNMEEDWFFFCLLNGWSTWKPPIRLLATKEVNQDE